MIFIVTWMVGLIVGLITLVFYPGMDNFAKVCTHFLFDGYPVK